MYGMEGNVVDRVDQGLVLRGGSLVAAVAFEGEVVGCVFLLDVPVQQVSLRGHPVSGEGKVPGRTRHALDGYPSLYATDGETVSAREAGNDTCLPLEWGRKGL